MGSPAVKGRVGAMWGIEGKGNNSQKEKAERGPLKRPVNQGTVGRWGRREGRGRWGEGMGEGGGACGGS